VSPLYVAAVSNDFSAEIMGLQVVQHGPDARVVTVTGEVDSLTAPELATFLTAQLTAVRLVVVDLDGVEFLGSAGLAVLFEANELAIQQDRGLRLVCHSRIVNRAMDVTELRRHFTFADTVADAVKDLP
jgi:anti-sigma B factor antagonist